MLLIAERKRLVTYERRITVKLEHPKEGVALEEFLKKELAGVPYTVVDNSIVLNVTGHKAIEHTEQYYKLEATLRGFIAGWRAANA